MRLPLIYSKSSSFSRFEFAGNCILVLAGGRQIGGKHNIYIYRNPVVNRNIFRFSRLLSTRLFG